MDNFGEESRKSLNEMLRMYCVELCVGLMWHRNGKSGGILNAVMNKCYITSRSEDA
jgi:hypothetical protein